ncbi:PREDICTED: HIPL1 protein isoform X1 [Theobroma cacao]|uniref:HIPL1 protein isoform X1 n=1 Tax=Theobroma cacao TaxID=3641 RepID=A0AB32V943_THECC|nr:PREDICTED: HIPL1 protein isoform X1 [Theobroma cacao]
MAGVLTVIFIFSCQLLLTHHSSPHPLCTNLRAPITSKTPLSFCQYNGSVCCNSTEDLQLRNQFKSMNVSDSGCASLLKSILCSRCDQFSAELYQFESIPRPVPVLCNSSLSTNSSLSQLATIDFCSKVWDECHNVSITSSPFALQGKGGILINSTSKLTDLWQSTGAFCDEFGGASYDGATCFAGGPVMLNSSESPTPPSGICLEKIGNAPYLNMVAHPDGSSRVILSNQEGKIWLATVPEEGSGEILGIVESNPLLDLTDEVHSDSELGFMGMAFHPNFQKNGRLFGSFNCDKVQWAGCLGRCSCNTDVGCDPSKLSSDNGAQPCQYHSVIAEFTTNGTTSDISSVTRIRPVEVRRILTIGLPFTSHHGGQILFGPEDGYLYFMMGDGGGIGDPYSFSQNKRSLLGKILRLDIDSIPSAKATRDLGLWGNYSIPKDNPFSEDKELLPEIWALGFRNPWRCSFDSERPSYFLCADVGQDQYEEVDIVTKGGNYGWRFYEGPFLYNSSNSSVANKSASPINAIFPVMGYKHSDVNQVEGSASITGGYFYRSRTDPCLYGRYLYADLYADAIWAGTESPKGSGNFTTSELPIKCAHDSPIPCTTQPDSTTPALGFVFSFGQDNRKDIFILASSGVYRIVRPSRCNYTCSRENVTDLSGPETVVPPSTSPSTGSKLTNPLRLLQVFPCASLFLLLSFFL